MPRPAAPRTAGAAPGLWFLVETGAWLAALAGMTASGAGWLQRPAAQRRLGCVSGIALIGIGPGLAADTR
ncbi:MAG TPA: hypothetical protein VFX25_05985 [Streptosporangiaceae bacterium]|nr:hypothetical protein [Streptosporangiaceae bacterium]